MCEGTSVHKQSSQQFLRNTRKPSHHILHSFGSYDANEKPTLLMSQRLMPKFEERYVKGRELASVVGAQQIPRSDLIMRQNERPRVLRVAIHLVLANYITMACSLLSREDVHPV
jgi:hypothetical protein